MPSGCATNTVMENKTVSIQIALPVGIHEDLEKFRDEFKAAHYVYPSKQEAIIAVLAHCLPAIALEAVQNGDI